VISEDLNLCFPAQGQTLNCAGPLTSLVRPRGTNRPAPGPPGPSAGGRAANNPSLSSPDVAGAGRPGPFPGLDPGLVLFPNPTNQERTILKPSEQSIRTKPSGPLPAPARRQNDLQVRGHGSHAAILLHRTVTPNGPDHRAAGGTDSAAARGGPAKPPLFTKYKKQRKKKPLYGEAGRAGAGGRTLV